MTPTMGKGRLEAFSDGVIAVAITIMVLDLKAPITESADGLRPLLPKFLCYVLSFINIGLYWNNHHHLLHAAKHVSGRTLWANLHLLFWLTLIPFVTGWMGESGFGTWPVAAYGVVMLLAATAWQLLATELIRTHGKDSTLHAALGRKRKEWASITLYILGIALALAAPRVLGEQRATWGGIAGSVLYTVVAVMWLVPDRRIERAMGENGEQRVV